MGVIIIFPNPNNGEFQLSMENTTSDLLIEIFNPMGIKIHSEIKKSGNSYYINLQNEATATGNAYVFANRHREAVINSFIGFY
jgi:hypothetical protein